MKRLLFLCLLFPVLVHSQGILDGFMKGKGNLDLAFSYNFEESNNYYKGEKLTPVFTNITSIGFFAAFGLTDYLDVVTSIPYVQIGDESAFQDGGFYLRFRPVKLNLGKEVHLNAMVAAGYNTPLSNYQLDSLGAIGLQVTSIDTRAIIQLEYKGGFLQLQGGYTQRFDFFDDNIKNDVPNVLPLSAKIGVSTGKSYFDFWIDQQTTLGGEDDALNRTVPLQLFRVNYVKIGGTFYYALRPKFGLFMNFASTLKGRNTIDSNRAGVGIVVKWY